MGMGKRRGFFLETSEKHFSGHYTVVLFWPPKKAFYAGNPQWEVVQNDREGVPQMISLEQRICERDTHRKDMMLGRY